MIIQLIKVYVLKHFENFQKNSSFISFKYITVQTFVKAKRTFADNILYQLGKFWNQTQYLHSNNMDNEVNVLISGKLQLNVHVIQVIIMRNLLIRITRLKKTKIKNYLEINLRLTCKLTYQNFFLIDKDDIIDMLEIIVLQFMSK